MRRVLILAAVLTFVVLAIAVPVLVMLSGAVAGPPAVPGGCTKVGTPDRDIMSSDGRQDRLCSRGGNDYLASGGGKDSLFSGPGNDTAVGGDGPDTVVGHGGNDKLFSIDQVHGNDVLRGGPGEDRCFGDKGDRFRGCERAIRVGTSPAVEAVFEAYATQFLGIAGLGELFQNAAPVPPPAVTVTITTTVTAGIPPECVPPPATPPPSPCTFP